MRLAILGSTRGTNLTAIIDACKRNVIPASIEVVVSNKPDAGILQKAKDAGLHAVFVDPKDLSRDAYDALVSAELHKHQIDLIVLIGYMRILSATFVSEWEHKIINVHPSLLPAFAGKMDLAVHQAVLDAGVPETGCSVHYVTEAVDEGPVLLQKSCQVLKDDTAQTLKQRVQLLEGEALVDAIGQLVK